MGDLWLQVVPRDAADLVALDQDFRRKANAEDLAAYTRLLRADEQNPLRHDAVASLSFDAGHLDAAIEQYERSLQLNPASASTHYNIGIAYSATGDRVRARAHFEEAIRLDPDYAQAHNNLGALLYLAGDWSGALQHYRRAVALRPDNVESHTNLGALLSARSQLSEAVEQYQQALALRPDSPGALSGLAWIRATAWDPALRDGDTAVTFAERAADLTRHHDLAALDALAAAYASVGRFEAATEVVRSAIEQASSAGLTDVASRFTERLDTYQMRRPYRVPPPK
jgi:tetratricopeptide (TPR) repeat protein